MRLHFTLSPNKGPVSFDYPHFLTGAFHRWLGENEMHDGLSLYSLGWLQGGSARGGALHFPRGATWFVSAPDTGAGAGLLHRVAEAALRSPAVCCGMEVTQIEAQPTPEFGARRVFRADSPIFLRGPRTSDGLDPHVTFNDAGADELLTHVLRRKLIAAGMPEHAEEVSVGFDRGFQAPKTRLIQIQESKKRVNVCPIVAQGSPAALGFLWNVGAGHLTGCAFGSLV